MTRCDICGQEFRPLDRRPCPKLNGGTHYSQFETDADREMFERLTDEDLERAFNDCEIQDDGTALFKGELSVGSVAIRYRAVERWQPRGHAWTNDTVWEVGDEYRVEVVA